jgi:DNA-binding transcriptional LysR family regulator
MAIGVGLDWDDLRVFAAVARSGRVSQAARELGVEHTTVSRRVAALERDLGAPLFYRTARGYALTAHGESALASAEVMERAAFGLGARVRETAGTVAGRVRVAMLEELATYWLAPYLPALRERHPAIELEVLTGITPVDLTRGTAELAVRTPRPRQSGLAAVRLATIATGLYVARARIGRKQTRAGARVDATARGLPLCVYSDPYQRLQAAAWFQPVLAAGEIVLRTNSTTALAAAARAGVGYAVLPRQVGDAYEELMAVSADLSLGEFWLVTHPEYRRDPKVRAVAAFLRECAATLR